MTKVQIQDMLEKQVKLLSKRSVQDFPTDGDLAAMSQAMLDILHFLYKIGDDHEQENAPG